MVLHFLPGFTKSEPFSPDPTALQSILQNEGVKVGGFLSATPKNSIRPSGRDTSVYTVCISQNQFLINFYYFYLNSVLGSMIMFSGSESTSS